MVKRDKKNFYWITYIAIILLVVSSITLFFVFRNLSNLNKQTRSIDVRFEVGEIFGVNLDRTDLLDFGIIPPGTSSIGRMVSISNPYEFPIVVNVRFTGNAKEYLLVPLEQTINPEEEKNVSIWLSVPKNASLGNYSGKVIFQFKSVKS
ncbi:MAG TPA: hypothetical protein PLK34_02100 [Candidatus Pacearchaeota archaeon]|nr:hypothetical protein [Candidatus Pacearchaeota archaeon]